MTVCIYCVSSLAPEQGAQVSICGHITQRQWITLVVLGRLKHDAWIFTSAVVYDQWQIAQSARGF